MLEVVGARDNNLKNIDGAIPARHVHLRHRRFGRRQVDARDRHALQGARAAAQGRARHPGAHDRIEGVEHLDKIVDIDQSPIGRTPRSNPATYTGCFHADPRLVRRAARGEGARLRPGALLVQRQGRTLRGVPGRRRHQDRDALPARRLRPVRRCKGKRYNRETLEVTFKGKSIAEVLEMTVEEGAEFFRLPMGWL